MMAPAAPAQDIDVLFIGSMSPRRAHVLENGRVVLSGTGDELLHDPQLQKTYLGM